MVGLWQIVCAILLIFIQISNQSSPAHNHYDDVPKKICIGTNGRMSVPANRDRHYRNLKERFTNCTYVDGNLELTWLQDPNYDLSFLKYIREVTGYVLISHVDVRSVILPNLQIIRGRKLFQILIREDHFALLVIYSKMTYLTMPNLRDILKGNVGILDNYNLCHIKTINWKEIMSDPVAEPAYVYNFTAPVLTCSTCHKDCTGGCWGEGKENCQQFSKIVCSKQCDQGRCYGEGVHDCCNLFCAGGCTGPTSRDCLACKNFYDDGECKQECPQMKTYDTVSYSWRANPNGKYAYGATCVKDCPKHLLRDNGACVRACPLNKREINGTCVACDGVCPKTCVANKTIHAGNIDSFKNCTIIEGSVEILDHSFDGFWDHFPNYTFRDRYPKMQPEKLNVFKTVKEITGYINIQASNPNFTDLSYFENLETIGGRKLTEFFAALYIVKSSLTKLNLRSLKNIRAGSVYILENKNLCYVDTISWSKIVKQKEEDKFLSQNNKNESQCKVEGKVCHKECDDSGCWGPGKNQCLSCRRFKLGDDCIRNCNAENIYKHNSTTCGKCHIECDGKCHGPKANQCSKCKNVKDLDYCIPKCIKKYNHNGQCMPCHKSCVDGCFGKENNLGPNGCFNCSNAIMMDSEDDKVAECLLKSDACPSGFYSSLVQNISSKMYNKRVCRRCHPICESCLGYSTHVSQCTVCKKYVKGEHCVDECPAGHFTDKYNRKCVPCSSECSTECSGPTESDCKSCRNYRIYIGSPRDNGTKFNCTATCPPHLRYKIFPEDGSDPYCVKDQVHPFGADSFSAILGGSLGCIFLLATFLAVFSYLWWQRNKTKKAALKMTMTMMPYDDNEPLKPTNIKPNLAKLRIVKEAELRKGGILGFGAFGTVYKGVWVPEGENVKIPVAIKVLRDGSGTNVNKEILEEAYIMASVDHPNLLQLLAVCMTTQIMLVTQLMPLGCLLDYVRNNKDKIGSKPLLNWCSQIARGMAYLEERRLVHRDLAARNVLVQTPNCVKITDFGLAKLLDYNEDEYKAAGGKMPIKWLALECIQHRIFTHKSDVWAFGVTVWEILTYGGRPYEDVPARNVPDLLEKGERLQQPPICTIDVYMLMIRCWMLDAEGRPSFRELADQFCKMARDPGRFLVIQGDKLMRLPSYTPQDERELIRSLSSNIGGEGIIMAAEEYLQPKYGMIVPTSTSSNSDPSTPIKKVPMGPNVYGNNIATQDYWSGRPESPQNRQNMQREKKYAHLEAGVNGTLDQRPRGDSLTSRYCTDPLKMLDTEMGDDDCFEPDPNMSNGDPRYGWVGGMRLDLPVDEDDYLMPSQQPDAQNPHPYMDLINEGQDRNQHHHYDKDKVYAGKMNGTAGKYNNGPQRWGGMDNPEYHIMNSHAQLYGDHNQQTLGVPVLPHGQFNFTNPNMVPQHSVSDRSSVSSYATNSTVQMGNNLHPVNGNVKMMSNGLHTANGVHPINGSVKTNHAPRSPELPHDYYNELSQISQRQPRSETTV